MKVVFVCTGNTCRSPMAEGYLNSKKLKDVISVSAGLYSFGEPISENSLAVLAEKGIDMSGHISCPITFELCAEADKIICISPSHKQTLLSYGVNEEKLSVLGNGIADPYGGDIDTYRRCRDEIFAAIDAIFCETTITKCAMTDFDAKNIAALEKICFSSPWSESAVKESYDNGTIFFTAQIGDDFAGYCGLNTVLDEGYITNVAVKPEHRNKGVASALLKEIDGVAADMKLSFVSLEVRISNTPARKLYEKFGYTAVGERKNFYTDPNENALIMTKRFDNEDTQH